MNPSRLTPAEWRDLFEQQKKSASPSAAPILFETPYGTLRFPADTDKHVIIAIIRGSPHENVGGCPGRLFVPPIYRLPKIHQRAGGLGGAGHAAFADANRVIPILQKESG
ncbi:hypothetical protein ABLB84_09250, partial [Xenorhabdus szentirmaii]